MEFKSAEEQHWKAHACYKAVTSLQVRSGCTCDLHTELEYLASLVNFIFYFAIFILTS